MYYEHLSGWVFLSIAVIVWAVMQWTGKLPTVDAIQQFTSVLNSRGGNILVLSIGSIYFFRYSMYIFTTLLDMVKAGKINEDNAFALMAIQFVTTTAFGGAMGALLKTMTGETLPINGNGKSPNNPLPTPIPPKADSPSPSAKESQVTSIPEAKESINPTVQL